jgi:hypothetical protein
MRGFTTQEDRPVALITEGVRKQAFRTSKSVAECLERIPKNNRYTSRLPKSRPSGFSRGMSSKSESLSSARRGPFSWRMKRQENQNRLRQFSKAGYKKGRSTFLAFPLLEITNGIDQKALRIPARSMSCRRDGVRCSQRAFRIVARIPTFECLVQHFRPSEARQSAKVATART